MSLAVLRDAVIDNIGEAGFCEFKTQTNDNCQVFGAFLFEDQLLCKKHFIQEYRQQQFKTLILNLKTLADQSASSTNSESSSDISSNTFSSQGASIS